ncbi:hypothetical protein RHOSPDRAFT_34570 [Rhodotorula sp. JG-1b]|nr:hypothetical protein RHOSPDRAFT_34570 [Rhodotorula sp. JG-1b]
MSAAPRERRPRQSAARISYAEEQGGSDSDSSKDSDARPVKRARETKGPKKDGKAKKKSRASAYLWQTIPAGVLCGADSDDEEIIIKDSVVRVDFTTLLPVEVLLEICSHLLPASLWHLAFVNKRLHAALTSDSGAAMWRRKLEVPSPSLGDEDDSKWGILGGESSFEDGRTRRKHRREKMRVPPTEGGRPVNPLKLAALFFNKRCQVCETQTNELDYNLLARVCTSCVDCEGVAIGDTADDEALEELHPMTTKIVRTTCRVPSRLSSRKQRKPPYALLSDLRIVSERLEELQAEDDASGATTFTTTTRGGRQSGSRRRGGLGNQTDGYAISSGAEGSFVHLTPRVRAFVQERLARKADHDELATWLLSYGEELHEKSDEQRDRAFFERRLRAERLKRILSRIETEGLFKFDIEKRIRNFFLHPLVNIAEPLTDEVWQDIAPQLYRDLGRCVAHNILVHHGARNILDVNFDWDRIMPDLVEQPAALSDQARTYVLPQISELVDAEKKKSEEANVRQADMDADRERLAIFQIKKQFFQARLDKIRDAVPTLKARYYLPILADFCTLPVVCELWDDPAFAIDPAQEEADLAKWSNRFDEILEAIEEYKIDVRLATLKTILAATTDCSEAEIDALDVDILADPTYGDEFFLRPSSWVHCSSCVDGFGPLTEVLHHRQRNYRGLDPRMPAGLELNRAKSRNSATASNGPETVVELSLEVACAILSVCEAGGIDANESSVTSKTLDEKFANVTRFKWKNSEIRRNQHYKWDDLITAVCRDARLAHKTDEVLPVPDIVETGLSKVERRQLDWKRLQ